MHSYDLVDYLLVSKRKNYSPAGNHTEANSVLWIFSSPNSMVGALNKLPVAASGMIFFGDPVNFGSVTAVSTGFVAGLVYAVAKQNQSKIEKAKQAKLANNNYALREKA